MNPTRPYDEMRATDKSVRPHYRAYAEWLADKHQDFLPQKQREANALYTRQGITFAVYGDESGTERSIPFDIIPRIIRPAAWKIINDGACPRVRALNAFLSDVYHHQEILKAGTVPEA